MIRMSVYLRRAGFFVVFLTDVFTVLDVEGGGEGLLPGFPLGSFLGGVLIAAALPLELAVLLEAGLTNVRICSCIYSCT